MVERPLSMRENTAETFLLLTTTFMFFSVVSYCRSTGPFPFILFTVSVTYAGEDFCPPAQTDDHSWHLWEQEIDHGVLPYHSLSAIS